jgi:DNA-binding CsgD family transcriptional regulator
VVSETELVRLAVMVYEAASEPELWTGFLKRYTEAVSADFSVLQIHDLGQHISTVISGFGLSVPFTQSYNEYYSKLNLWRERGRAFLSPGRINFTEELCPRAVLERSEFYNDYMRHIGDYGVGIVVSREGTRVHNLSAQRLKRQFGDPEREIARFLLPHLSRAWTLHQRLDLLSAGESVLNTLPLGVVFLAAGGTAIYSNHAAEEMFRANDGLSLRQGMLSAVDRRAGAQLRKAIDDAFSPCQMPVQTAVSVPRPSQCREYRIVAAPLRTRFQQFVGTPLPLAVALITDPERQKPAGVQLLIQMYKLTPREAALGAKLSEGKSIRQAAQELSISYETARAHLRHIFSKTGTSRQAELLLLISRLPDGKPDQHG